MGIFNEMLAVFGEVLHIVVLNAGFIRALVRIAVLDIRLRLAAYRKK